VALGHSGLALAGVFAAAVAMRQVFACAVAAKVQRPRDVSVNLWEPWRVADLSDVGPGRFDVPDHLWFLGLGHLGQGFIWNLCLVGAKGGRAVVQDNQVIGEENEVTSLLVLPGKHGEKKARLGARWMEADGWVADIVERRHQGDIPVTENDPPYLLCGLDRLEPRLVMARHGFEFMIDAGLGHGPSDFEGIQIRTIAKGQSIEGLWSKPAATDDGDARAKILAKEAYAELEKHIGQCGIVSFADASAAVPFVGAATGALVIGQAIRLASLESATRFLHVELSAPEMVAEAGLTAGPMVNLGSTMLELDH